MKTKLKSVLPEKGFSKAKSLYGYYLRSISDIEKEIDSWILNVFTRFKISPLLYYLLFSSAFNRECRACLSGRKKYIEDLRATSNSSYLLRRNIHRIEKGILMKPRREIFATEYIKETVDVYEKMISCQALDCNSEENKWAFDVLSEYFAVVGSDKRIDKARDQFAALRSRDFSIPNEKKFVPYRRKLENHPVSYELFLELANRRRSVRWYLDKPVSRTLIDRAVDVASLSPSACNRQPFEFRVFDDPELAKEISALPMGTKGFCHNVPVIVVLVGKLSAYFSERDRHIIYIDGSLAAMSFMYALETLGLSSCPINWPDIEDLERKMDSLLRLERDERSIMLISVGHPDPEGMVAYSQKKVLDQIRRYN